MSVTRKRRILVMAWWVLVAGLLAARAAEPSARPAAAPLQATLLIQANRPLPYPIPTCITGKFCEHLGSNIYNGMSAQIVRNPTFAEWPFASGQMSPDGRVLLQCDAEKIATDARRQAARLNWPERDIERLLEARADGLAFWWFRRGPRDAVQVCPDPAPSSGRAQRIEVRNAGEGIAQWMYLPLHRTRKYEYQAMLRSPNLPALTLSISGEASEQALAQSPVEGISSKWQIVRGTFELPATAPADGLYRLSLTAPGAGQFVVAHLLLFPADNVGGADPDVVRLLRDSHLPLLRWPGGNFVSAYHFEDGIGPIEQRPARPNWAWGGIEPNLFGTDEFIAFCRAVGCEPMICINAGDGSPDEAARWIEYCNGPASSPMGAKRAANGHPQPYNVLRWEVGNELWGRWQNGWSTADGYADRYREFAEAMLKADPGIKLYACGAPVMWGKSWNDALLAGGGPLLKAITDHPLIGGTVAPSADPLDVYRDFMVVPDVLERKWAELRTSMLAAGIKEPRLAITELQMFAHIGGGKDGEPVRLTRQNLVTPATQAEALYDVLMYHTAIHLAPFVEFITHSATVNHGGGLRKERERVYANPCYYAQSDFAAFAGATPVAIQLSCPNERPGFVLGDVRGAGKSLVYSQLSAVAAIAKDGALLVSLVNRSGEAAGRVQIKIAGFDATGEAQISTLAAPMPWSANTLEAPEAIKPALSAAKLVDGGLALDLPPYSVMRIRISGTATGR